MHVIKTATRNAIPVTEVILTAIKGSVPSESSSTVILVYLCQSLNWPHSDVSMKCFKLKVTRVFNGSKWSVRHFKVGGDCLMVFSFMVIVVVILVAHTLVTTLPLSDSVSSSEL